MRQLSVKSEKPETFEAVRAESRPKVTDKAEDPLALNLARLYAAIGAHDLAECQLLLEEMVCLATWRPRGGRETTGQLEFQASAMEDWAVRLAGSEPLRQPQIYDDLRQAALDCLHRQGFVAPSELLNYGFNRNQILGCAAGGNRPWRKGPMPTVPRIPPSERGPAATRTDS